MAKDTLKVGGVKYTTAEKGYFEKRGLKRSAGIWALWGLAIAAVISGDFSGWNFGIDFAGFGGMTIAFVLVVIMYYALVYSIGEMASAMPHTGGAYSFARAAMGPWGGFITGIAETIEYVATTAVIVFFSASYADNIFVTLLNIPEGGHALPMWLWYVILYAVFIAINAAGAALSFRFAIVVSFISIAILVVFFVMALASGQFSFDKLWDIPADAGQTTFLPHGVLPILFALPFAMWFFLGI
jgi:ethanolamine permease